MVVGPPKANVPLGGAGHDVVNLFCWGSFPKGGADDAERVVQEVVAGVGTPAPGVARLGLLRLGGGGPVPLKQRGGAGYVGRDVAGRKCRHWVRACR